jgi:tetratricopeptide (TPR) repeat protein
VIGEKLYSRFPRNDQALFKLTPAPDRMPAHHSSFSIHHFNRSSRVFPCLAFAAVFLLGIAQPPLLGRSPDDDPSPQALIKAGHWKRARASVEPLYTAAPNDAELNYLMSQIDDAFGDLAGARSLAEKAVALKGTESRYHRQLADVDGETAETASLFAKGGWAKKFKAECETAAALDPKNLDARFDLLEYDLQAPRLMGGGKDKAAAMAEEIARIDPAQGYMAQARLAQDRKDGEAQESWLLKATAAQPNDYDILAAVANFYLNPAPANLPSAEKYARRAIQADPGRSVGYALLASCLASGSRWDDLEGTLAQAEAKVPDDRVPAYRAGVAILTLANPDSRELTRAENYFRKYLSAEPEGGEPPFAAAHWRLGEVLEKEGRKNEAIAELQTAVRLKPDLEGAQKDLNRLE